MSAKVAKKTLPQSETQNEDTMILNEVESKYFKEEINEQLAETKIIDIGKAARNARYLAMLDEGFEDMRAGKGVSMTFEELEQLINA